MLLTRRFSSNHTYHGENQSHKTNRSEWMETKKYSEQFETLELAEDSNRETVRRQYISLVKKYHPDTAKYGEQDLEKFHSIDQAYKTLLRYFAKLDKDDKECEGEYGLYYKVLLYFKGSVLVLRYLCIYKYMYTNL